MNRNGHHCDQPLLSGETSLLGKHEEFINSGIFFPSTTCVGGYERVPPDARRTLQRQAEGSPGLKVLGAFIRSPCRPRLACAAP